MAARCNLCLMPALLPCMTTLSLMQRHSNKLGRVTQQHGCYDSISSVVVIAVFVQYLSDITQVGTLYPLMRHSRAIGDC